MKIPAFQQRGKVVGYFSLSFRHNPYLYLQGLLKDKKISLSRLRTEVQIENKLLVRQASSVCALCQKESGLISMLTGKQIKYGLECLPKALLKLNS